MTNEHGEKLWVCWLGRARVSVCVLILICSLFVTTVYCTEREPDQIDIQDKLGQHVPLDLTFRDENGSPVKLKDIVDKPTVLTLVYYHCGHICPQMLLGLCNTFLKMDLVPGRDYKVITLSFDDTDTPEDARIQKINYMKALNRKFSEDAWKFLTGDKENIRQITESAGFKYRKVMHGFVHPEIVIFLSPDGKITRYLHVATSSYGLQYPVIFSPVAFTGALTDAAEGKVGTCLKNTPLLCFPHEPVQQERFYKILSISGAVTLLLIFSLFMYLKMRGKNVTGGKE
jgi:protein SCO1